MVFSRFASQLFARVVALFALIAALAAVLVITDFVAVAAILGAAAVAQAWAVIRFVNRTNAELTRFLEAIRYDDFTQSFSIGHLGESFADLKSAFEDVMERFRSTRTDREIQRRYLETLIEHVPVAIISVGDGGAVSLLNNAARRLLDSAAETTVGELDRYGASFQQDVNRAATGDRTLTRARIDGVERQLILSTTQITMGGNVRRLISLQDIQTELDATELSAWQDMVRVLSHEIGNSITPIASLARTADDMVVDLRERIDDRGETAELISDIHDAIDTITRRSEGLMRFVKSYRELTRLPPPKKRQISLRSYFARLERLLAAEWSDRGVTLHMGAPAEGLTIAADESLLDQAIINVVRNAADAASAADDPQVWLDARLSERGRPVIEIADNGSGFDAEIAEKIFLPFFTTKADGSGIGLSLARQVMLLHRGAISARPRDGGGALFQLSF
jgi:nitrogen fixation/metabolism regulation signal transduction histidine kinase